MESWVDAGPGSRLQAAMPSSNSWALRYSRRSTQSSRSSAMCAGGPPKPRQPIRPHSRATVSRGSRGMAAPYPGPVPAEVTLTFDNGPDPAVTPHVLDVLAAHGLRATFFVVGEQLARARELAERAHAEGHWIGNHTWTHRAPFGRLDDASAPHREIERTQALIGA